MKTSLEISDHLFIKVKKLATKRGTSVRALIDESLRLLLAGEEIKQPIQAKLLTFGGDGFTERYEGSWLSWDQIREEIYRGHGS
jgi:hypothetical protein